MLYDIYHDESSVRDFWHVLLFVPRSSRGAALARIQEIKSESKLLAGSISFKGLSSDTSYVFAESALTFLNSAFQQRQKSRLEYYRVGRNVLNPVTLLKATPHVRLERPLRFKVAIFHLRDGHETMSCHYDKVRKIETTLRMCIQGAAHRLFSIKEPIEIGRIFLDGEEHYKRELDRTKILQRLKFKAREYCTVANDCQLSGTDLATEDRSFLDLADLYLGAFRAGVLRPTMTDCDSESEIRKHQLSKLIAPLIDRLNQGGARMRHSRFINFGTFSSAWVEKGEWQFENLAKHFMMQPSPNNVQLRMFT